MDRYCDIVKLRSRWLYRYFNHGKNKNLFFTVNKKEFNKGTNHRNKKINRK